MLRVIIESPYAAATAEGIEENVTYARKCMAHSLSLGEAPIASHLIYTQPGILKDAVPEERSKGIAAGLEWRKAANYSAFYTDRGWSSGMIEALGSAIGGQLPFHLRSLSGQVTLPPGAELSHYQGHCFIKLADA